MITTGFGYISATNSFDEKFLFVLLGTLLLACGSAVFNHYQERNVDSLMERTKSRPIPSGRISSQRALKIGLVLTFLGSLLLLFFVNHIAFILGMLNLIWYNLIYTPLKRKTSLAIIPGSVVGAIPPVIGWVAAGGYVFDFRILVISFFFFIWQIPHFWLLMLKLDDDYKSANLPTVTNLFSKKQLARITFSWTVATGLSSVLIPISLKITNSFTLLIMLLMALAIIVSSLKLLRFSDNKFSEIFVFRSINFFVLSVIVFISLNKLVL
jgi:protoheme IX farnesyltransferase